MEARYRRVPVLDAGGFTVHLPLVELGPEPARLVVVAGIHGDEPAPLLLIDRLVRALSRRDLAAGVRIIAAANPPALLARSRWSPWDHQDMNRVGGRDGASFTHRTAEAIAQLTEGAALCVNLHNFVMKTPLLAVSPPVLPTARREREATWLERFDPRVIWAISDSVEDRAMYESTLDRAIERLGVDVLAVETSDLPQLDAQEVQRACWGLLRLARAVGCLTADAAPPPQGRPVRVHRRLVRSTGVGIFEPHAPLMSWLVEGDVVGHLVPLERPGARVDVRAPVSGWLIQRAGQGFFRAGDQIAAVGVPVGAE